MNYEKIPAFTPDTHKNCKGHSIEVLEMPFDNKKDRDLLVSVLSNYINEKDGIQI